jgi:hypothetical protein
MGEGVHLNYFVGHEDDFNLKIFGQHEKIDLQLAILCIYL